MTFQTYNTPLPVSGNNPSVDQPSMTTNNASVANLIAQDHFGFNNNAGGNHKWVHLKNTSAPGGLGANADGVLYANLINGNSWPIWQNALGPTVIISGPTTSSTTGSTSLSGGIILQWGQGTTNGAGIGTISFNPNFSTFFSASLTRIETGGNNRGFIQFTALPTGAGGSVMMRDGSGSGIAGSFLWIAIGAQ
jgi:hypothetical protein